MTTTPHLSGGLSPLTGVGRPDTLANAVTLLRTLLAVGVGMHGIATDDARLLLVAYAVYWVGDMADGWTARRLGQETRLGAVLDVVCDRACTVLLCAGLVAHRPELEPVVLVFVLSFAVLDTMLSLSFLCWPLLSPNHFARVDRRVYELNWSPLAKAVNTAGVVGALAIGQPGVAFVIALLVTVAKCWSAGRVLVLLRAGASR